MNKLIIAIKKIKQNLTKQKQYVLWDPDKGSPEIYIFNKKINFEDIIEWFEINRQANWDRDSVTLIDKPEKI